MSDYFPREIWVEILHRQTLKSLVKCISVCKAWKSLVTDRAFIFDHISRTMQANSLFLQLYHRKKERDYEYFDYEEFYSLYSDNEQIDYLPILRFPLPLSCQFLCEYSQVVGTCNGLVCFADDSVSSLGKIIIWNPTIRKYVVLPKPRVTFSGPDYERYRVCFGFGFNSKNRDFKVVRLVTPYKKEGTPQVEVYSLATGSWRSIVGKAPPFLLCSHPFLVRWTVQVFINGKLHWVVSRRSNGQIHNFILCFDVGEETFGELMLPGCLKDSPLEISILSGGDSLAVLHTHNLASDSDRKVFSIWVMKEYGVVKSWTEVFHCDSIHYGKIASVLALRSSGEVVLEVFSKGIILLDPKKELVKDLGVRGFFDAFAGHHVESLFLINKENNVLSY